MFARQGVMQLEPDSAAEFARIIENEVSPPLRGQKGSSGGSLTQSLRHEHSSEGFSLVNG
jgi:hypothetical protein